MIPAESVLLEQNPCPLSCPPSDIELLKGSDRLHDLPGLFTVVRCACCGLARTSPRPTPATIGAYYPADYGPYKGTVVPQEGNSDQRGFKSRLLAFGRRLFDTKATSLPDMPPGSMLEIGCASGSFLHAMAGRGWLVDGIEFSPEAAATARALGYHVSTGSVESVERAEGLYDLVVGWMVLEHLHDPVGALRKIASWSKPNAKLAISVPDAGAAEFRLFGARWYALQLPTHLYHYDATSINKILDAGGWRVTRIQRHRTLANVIASLGYWLHDKGFVAIGGKFIRFPETGGRLGALLLFPLAYLAALAGQTGRMTVWAERKNK
jgi:2-polyprenyl-3-methyl-5-hydroxy-6-metoxy-1,4-benzoquinol methylase